MNIRYPIYEGVYRILTLKLAAPGSTGIIILSHIPYLFYLFGHMLPNIKFPENVVPILSCQ